MVVYRYPPEIRKGWRLRCGIRSCNERLLCSGADHSGMPGGNSCGDGGIPGYIIGSIVPNERSLSLLPVALAHETNHNVRWQFMKWSSQITLADMIVSE
ncbi:MAG: DUF2268 domain-containing protein [Firmicutes bacterium]|nr:DUF2268 domain-containing protein [Bacillota bacterium]